MYCQGTDPKDPPTPVSQMIFGISPKAAGLMTRASAQEFRKLLFVCELPPLLNLIVVRHWMVRPWGAFDSHPVSSLQFFLTG